MKRPAFWILFACVSVLSAAAAYHYFPQAFSIVALEITMDRDRALTEARAIMARDGRGPTDYRQAASFTLDRETQTFVELEGGGKQAFTEMLREELYAAYTWRVRHFREGEKNETEIRFTPDGRLYGFVERLKEDAPGAALDAAEVRTIAETAARETWGVDLDLFALVEQGQERRPGGRIDHTLTYERAAPTLNEGRYRLRLVVSGDRLTEATHFIQIPEAFTRRFEHMRSANQAIGIGSSVAMMLLYVIGGIGIGLFVMLRQRQVIWRPAAVWGAGIGALQALAMLNAWPQLWMTYDTAIPRGTFVAQQIAVVLAVLVGMSVFFALTFMAAETLTRRAFPSHPQFWTLWSRRAGSSTAVAGRTAAGYLLVGMFLAYAVGVYLLATRAFGWWTPSETLLHPDVLATYVPWLSAIANSLQAGFWEECLFRAIPLAGAALIGDRLGQRRLCLAVALILQAAIFGGAHAPYPTLPAYARPVELMLPSIGFGLLYIYFGLLPAIILHFAYDVVWFALPIFVATAPGIWMQQAMVVMVTLLPVWVVLWRRVQAGAWTTLPESERNAAWTPPPVAPRVAVGPRPHYDVSARARQAWSVLGAGGILACAVVLLAGASAGELRVSREEAAGIARRGLEARGVQLDERWRVLPTVDPGGRPPHEFVSRTAGEERRRALIGTYLPSPIWRVRVATFEGDVAERAEEWQVLVNAAGEIRTIRHTVPEGRALPSLEEPEARQRALEAAMARTGVGADNLREVSARPSKLSARTDWTFTFVDETVALPEGEARVQVDIAGEDVASTGVFVHVPEEWQRANRAAATRNMIAGILAALLFGGILLTAGVMAVVRWSRREYAPRLFVATAAVMLLVSVAAGANGWPGLLAGLSTAQPLLLQAGAIIAIGLVGLTLVAAMVGLILGGVPHQLAVTGRLPEGVTLRLGIAVGLFGAGVSAAAGWLQTPAWARTPDVEALATFLPFVQRALDPVGGLLLQAAVLLAFVPALDRATSGWTRRRVPAAVALVVFGFLTAGGPAGSNVAGWLAAGLLTGAALLTAYVTVLRADLTMLPLSLGTMAAVMTLMQGLQRPFPGALAGSIVGALLAGLAGWWLYRALRRHASAVTPGAREAVPVAAGGS